uniref:Uncharacterized protein n=1 Tax=Vespula pensylvanica TaxID=30213 RepID=A0A834P309_VESPE|nr:hypothetical protein H0235_008319 [Vespula pensylvanica]
MFKVQKRFLIYKDYESLVFDHITKTISLRIDLKCSIRIAIPHCLPFLQVDYQGSFLSQMDKWDIDFTDFEIRFKQIQNTNLELTADYYLIVYCIKKQDLAGLKIRASPKSAYLERNKLKLIVSIECYLEPKGLKIREDLGDSLVKYWQTYLIHQLSADSTTK